MNTDNLDHNLSKHPVCTPVCVHLVYIHVSPTLEPVWVYEWVCVCGHAYECVVMCERANLGSFVYELTWYTSRLQPLMAGTLPSRATITYAPHPHQVFISPPSFLTAEDNYCGILYSWTKLVLATCLAFRRRFYVKQIQKKEHEVRWGTQVWKILSTIHWNVWFFFWTTQNRVTLTIRSNI